MKELTIEQKAQRYDEAIEGIQEILSSGQDSIKMSRLQLRLQGIFPKLKESEDEKIRKEIIDFIYDKTDTYELRERSNSWLAWLEKQGEVTDINPSEFDLHLNKLLKQFETLPKEELANSLSFYLNVVQNDGTYVSEEKQGEQKPTVIIPKFRVGDEIKTSNEESLIITKIDEKGYWSEDLFICSFEDSAKWELVGKLVDKVESKFHKGDWILNNVCLPIRISSIEDGMYVFDDGSAMSIPFIDENYHLWTIQDAKDSDVLCYKDEISLYKHDIKNCIKQETTFGGFVYHCCYDGKRFITDSLYSLTEQDKIDIHPATKEQCDLLFQKMKEAGYEWNAEKKELKKIHNVLEECEIEHVEHGKYYYCIKDYYTGGNKRVSKGDVVQALNGMNMMALGVKANEYFIPVKRIVDTKHDWSEEDEKMLTKTLYLLDAGFNNFKCTDGIAECKDWLKSLKDRVGCEANYTTMWKPSEEQVKALEHFVRSVGESGYASLYENNTKLLYSLLEQLKKLREE